MANSTYAVTSDMVADRHFPQLVGKFTAQTRPTAATVTSLIGEAAADLNGVLGKLGITQPTSGQAQAFAWAQKTVMLCTAAQAALAMPGRMTEVAKEFQKQCDARLKELEENPSILTDATQPASAKTGFANAVRDLALKRGETTDFTDNVLPAFRRDDKL